MAAFSRAALAAAAALAASASGAGFQYKERYACGVCQEIHAGRPCSTFGEEACAAPYASAPDCEEACKEESDEAVDVAAAPAHLELRVAKGFGKRAYDQVRISVITNSPEPPAAGFFDYSAQFKYKWTQFYLHSALKSVQPGSEAVYNLGTPITVRLPAQGAGVAGILLADPCVNSPTGKKWIGCKFGKKHHTITRIPELINTFGGSVETDFWSISGDMFYDRTGEITDDVYSRISLDVKSKVFNAVPGNHDYWVHGSPEAAAAVDQCGYGFMQYYGQDTKAGENVTAGSKDAPFDLTKDPNANMTADGGCKLTTNHNFLWYHQLGNLGMVGQTGAFSLKKTEPFMREACRWLSKQPGLEVVVLFGHWDVKGLGASAAMAMPKWYTEMAALPGCSEYNKRGMMKFVMGHTHCNDPHPHGEVNAGFRVAGFGMEGCGNFGMPIVDTTDGRVRFWYFDTQTNAKYKATVACVKESGWRKCTQHATLWLDQAIVPKPKAEAGVTISV